MRKYGKRIKKTRRTFRKTSRFARKARKIRYRKRFERRLNSVAEKKVTWEDQADVNLYAATATAQLGDALIKYTWPNQGPENYNRIGTKIFIRYITVNLWIYNISDTQKCNGRVGVIIIKERRPGSARTIRITDLFYNNAPILNQSLYKNSQIKKIWLKTRHMHYNSAELPQSINYKFKFKIMKNCSRDDATLIPDLADIHVIPVYFPAPYTAIGSTSPAKFTQKVIMSFTDV